MIQIFEVSYTAFFGTPIIWRQWHMLIQVRLQRSKSHRVQRHQPTGGVGSTRRIVSKPIHVVGSGDGHSGGDHPELWPSLGSPHPTQHAGNHPTPPTPHPTPHNMQVITPPHPKQHAGNQPKEGHSSSVARRRSRFDPRTRHVILGVKPQALDFRDCVSPCLSDETLKAVVASSWCLCQRR